MVLSAPHRIQIELMSLIVHTGTSTAVPNHRFLAGPRGLANGFFSSPMTAGAVPVVSDVGSSSRLIQLISTSEGSDVSIRLLTTTW